MKTYHQMGEGILLVRGMFCGLALVACIACGVVITGCASLDGLTAQLDRPEVQELFDQAVTRLREELAKTNAVERIEDAVAEIGEQVKPEDPGTGVDAVPYGSLSWSYGGFNGSGAIIDPAAQIKDLSFGGNTLYYKWASGGCENFGASHGHDHTQTMCCVFFKRSDGTWRGGKFDWVSTDRLSRGLGHCSSYKGWTLSGVPNPAESVYVIVGQNGRRTNVIKGVWKR